MKIAILVSTFPPKWLAGTEIATYNIALHLARRGHEVHVITSWDRDLPRESKEEGFYVHRVKRSRVRFLGIVVFWSRVLLLLRRVEPQLVHTQNIAMGICGYLVKRFLGNSPPPRIKEIPEFEEEPVQDPGD